jgi:hypothetical protein
MRRRTVYSKELREGSVRQAPRAGRPAGEVAEIHRSWLMTTEANVPFLGPHNFEFLLTDRFPKE